DHNHPEPRTDQERQKVLDNFTGILHTDDLELVAVIPLAAANRPRDQALTCQVYLISNSAAAREALAYFETLMAAANEEGLKARLGILEIGRPITMLSVERVVIDVSSPDNILSLSALVPLVLILMTITGAVYPAIDLTAGERERGTLEILIAAPVPRFELL